MGFTPTKTQVYAFLQDAANPRGVLAYFGARGCPDTARMAFSSTQGLEIIFGTSNLSRKYSRISADSRVGFNVTDDIKRHTVQMQGLVHELRPEDLKLYEADHYAKLGQSSQRFQDRPNERFFLIQPTSVRFSDCSEDPFLVTVIEL
jgi:hypothetical protein